ncbi:MAG: prolipoprotein diacylglyceryl transferase, partial [Deltaproteobacteria bacterium]
MHPILFSLDLFGLLHRPYSLHTYGLFIATGFLLAVYLSRRQAEREEQDAEAVVDLAFYLLIAGLIGARIVFILTKLPEFWENPLEIFMVWR